ncbi:ATP-binding protein [Prosthecodimorpha hirschii]|uniref:ATP-binding protein n=1 Tax=Prosthecodimorpha hirschii TaxID=665126 RepID=UPI0015E29876|nr:ATP-binding protein [Prosthecomicrobium hirschii]
MNVARHRLEPRGLILAVAAALIAVAWAAVSGVLYIDARRAEDAARQDVGTTAAIFSEQAVRVIRSIDDVLRFAANGIADDPSPDALRRLVERKVIDLDLLVQLAFVDAQGLTLGTDKGPDPNATSVADREHIRVHLDRKTEGLFVGKPVVGRVSKRWSIQITRRIEKADGSLVGVVVASLDPHFFERFWAKTIGSQPICLRLIGRDGVLRAQSDDVEQALADNPDFAATVAALDAAGGQEAYRADRTAIVSLRAVEGFPLLVSAEMPRSEVASLIDVPALLTVGVLATLSILLMAALVWRSQNHLAAEQHRSTASERRLREAVDALPDAFTMYDPTGRLVACNRAFVAFVGLDSPAEAIGHTHEDLVRKGVAGGTFPDAAERPEDYVAARQRLFETVVPNYEFRAFGDRTFTITQRRTETGDTVAIRVEVTEQRRREAELAAGRERLKLLAEAADAANRAKTQFVATMSHELRTPLVAITGYARLLSEEPIGGRAAGYAATIVASSEHLSALVTDVLDFSQLEAGEMALSQAPFDVKDCVEQVAAIARGLVGTKPVTIRTEVAPDIGARRGDPIRIRQILINIAGNAAKFTDAGQIRIQAGRLPDRSGIELVVADTGPGIPAEDRETVFEPFRQLERLNEQGLRGTGLGLAISRRLVRLMNGTVAIEDNPGGGTRFRLTLPLPPAEMPAAAESGGPSDPVDAPPSLTILVAEDVPVSRMLMETLLKRKGHTAHCVVDGQEAVEWARAHDFDLALLDLQMPRLGGMDAARLIRQETADRPKPVTIVALTADATPQTTAEALASGIDVVVVKPFKFTELDRVIALAAGRSKAS